MTRLPYPPAKREQEGVYTPDNLITGDRNLLRAVKTTITVPANTTYERGLLSGRVFGVETSVKAGNAATLTLTAVAAGLASQVGRYVVRVATGGNAAAQRYDLFAPDGIRIASGIRSGVANPTVLGVGFTLTATGNNAVLGDEVYIDVVASKWAKAEAGGADGRQRPAGVLVNRVENKTAAPVDKACEIYTQGEFNWNEIDSVTPNHGFTFRSLEARLAEKGLALEEVLDLSEVPVI